MHVFMKIHFYRGCHNEWELYPCTESQPFMFAASRRGDIRYINSANPTVNMKEGSNNL